MSFDSANTNSRNGEATGMTCKNSVTRLELENAYLAQQNEHLQRELSFARYTISALKTITYQKETTLDETKVELERAYLRIKMLGLSMMRQQQQRAGPNENGGGLVATTVVDEEEKPMLIMDTDSSDDQQELSDEEDPLAVQQQPMPPTPPPGRRPLSSIMTKLPLRQHPTMIFENQHQQQLSSPPTSPL
ncbi:unnamed protein product [Absidia cylindrospora]